MEKHTRKSSSICHIKQHSKSFCVPTLFYKSVFVSIAIFPYIVCVCETSSQISFLRSRINSAQIKRCISICCSSICPTVIISKSEFQIVHRMIRLKFGYENESLCMRSMLFSSSSFFFSERKKNRERQNCKKTQQINKHEPRIKCIIFWYCDFAARSVFYAFYLLDFIFAFLSPFANFSLLLVSIEYSVLVVVNGLCVEDQNNSVFTFKTKTNRNM